ncbi:Kelch-like protein 20 [Chelonia mydas]|uniref:Kelch-like protein 20 n=1 Tax=Chelonia mydas TaxID=8469 RepID=M7C2H1_CHEMY|nr:Kelch-like protein 20 [Chelonia mydas]
MCPGSSHGRLERSQYGADLGWRNEFQSRLPLTKSTFSSPIESGDMTAQVKAAAANGYLLATGGGGVFDGVTRVTPVEAFDLDANKWRPFGNTKTSHPGGGVAVLKMTI